MRPLISHSVALNDKLINLILEKPISEKQDDRHVFLEDIVTSHCFEANLCVEIPS